MSTDTATPNRQQYRGKSLRLLLTLAVASILAAFLVALGAALLLSRNLPRYSGEELTFPVSSMRFVFGSGIMDGDLVHVNVFADGYALISSGLINIQADEFRVLRYTWLPTQRDQEAAFFWRRADDPGNVTRIDIISPGTQIIDLSGEPGWSGKIVEAGFLVAGESGQNVSIGSAVMVPDNLATRVQLTWKAWTGFEHWSLQSINFLYGGSRDQVLSLPLLVAAWFVITLLLIELSRRIGMAGIDRKMPLIAGALFLLSWMLLDLRWVANNVRQVRTSLETRLNASEQQRLYAGLDGELYQWLQELMSSVLEKENARVLVIGDDDAVDYFLLRAKYHLLPYSVNVARNFPKNLVPESLDFVIYFGQPANIANVEGWNSAWRDSLIRIKSGEWGDVFRVRKK